MMCETCEFMREESCIKLLTDNFDDCKFYVSIIPDDLTVKSCMSDGAHRKFWVSLPDGREGLYKINKQTSIGTYTFENISEVLAKRIGDVIGVPVCDVQLYDNAVLSFAHNKEPLCSFLSYSEEFTHSYHMSNLQTFNISSLLNPCNNAYCSEVIAMLLFDILIGNSDRHPGNFAVTSYEFYPLYDNGSSLCAYVNERDIVAIMKDDMHWQALQYSKSKPVLRDDQQIMHYQLLKLLQKQFPQDVDTFSRVLSSLNIAAVLQTVSSFISEKRYSMLSRFLAERKAWFYE